MEPPDGARLQAARGDTVRALRVGELAETGVAAHELRVAPAPKPE